MHLLLATVDNVCKKPMIANFTDSAINKEQISCKPYLYYTNTILYENKTNFINGCYWPLMQCREWGWKGVYAKGYGAIQMIQVLRSDIRGWGWGGGGALPISVMKTWVSNFRKKNIT